MEIALEQFISSDKSKTSLSIMKNISILLILLGLILLILFFKPLGFLFSILGLVLLIIRKYWYVDYEYELYNGNIDVSKIYSCTRRKLVKKIKVDEVESVYSIKNNQINKNGAKAFFNSNIEGLTIYIFKLKNSEKIQIALNDEFEKVVKIIYKSKMIL